MRRDISQLLLCYYAMYLQYRPIARHSPMYKCVLNRPRSRIRKHITFGFRVWPRRSRQTPLKAATNLATPLDDTGTVYRTELPTVNAPRALIEVDGVPGAFLRAAHYTWPCCQTNLVCNCNVSKRTPATVTRRHISADVTRVPRGAMQDRRSFAKLGIFPSSGDTPL